MNKLNANQVRGVLLSTSHYTKVETERTPKGTLMLHYALTEFGSKEVEEEYETSKGEYSRTVDKGEYKDKPIHFTSQIFEGVSEGDEVTFDFINGRLQRTESLEQRIAKSAVKKQQSAMAKVLSSSRIAEIQLAASLGMSLGR